jgi:hypothetical protein
MAAAARLAAVSLRLNTPFLFTQISSQTMSTTHPITPALAHVSSVANLLVDNVTACAEPHTYRSVFAVDGTHPYLYENPAIANMGRQLLKAISHIYYDIPMDSRFALHGIDIEFLRWARIAVDIELVLACG